MKIFLTIGILVIVAGVLALVFLGHKDTAPVTDTQDQSGFPTASPVGVGVVDQASGGTVSTITVADQKGGAVVTKDFVHNSTTVEDPSNAGNYYLTGESKNGYSIGYRTPAQFFTIALEREPLGEMRAAAEKFLLSALGVTPEQLCSLNYYIGTDAHTNSFYGGKNLGFSFCPGAVTLPK